LFNFSLWSNSYPITVGAGGAAVPAPKLQVQVIRNPFNIFNNYISRWWRRWRIYFSFNRFNRRIRWRRWSNQVMDTTMDRWSRKYSTSKSFTRKSRWIRRNFQSSTIRYKEEQEEEVEQEQ
jgi:hypothetical protein